MPSIRFFAPFLAATCLLAGQARAADIQFNRDIRPLLSDRCFHCHGPDEHERKADLRLDRAEGPEGAYEAAIVPGSAESSEVWARITSDDPDEVMPPPDGHKKPLTESEKGLVKQWIESGAPYEDFWAFVPPAKPDLSGKPDSVGAIDALVRRRLEAEGLSPAESADRRTLIRRVTLDLTGLPPTREEIAAFLADDSEDAWATVVDRLLDSPHFGEHVGRYWLDVVRFADTNGIHHDHYRELSPYRDWVIRAFNGNLPYDQFIRDNLAGDLLPKPTTDQLVASGFHRLHLIIDRGTALPEESFTRNVLDRVESVGTAFLGLTVQCAVCHDHKYDPITMRDYYSLFAFFNNFDGEPETGGRAGTDFRRGLQPPYISLADEKEEARLAELTRAADAADAEVAGLKKQLEAVQGDPEKRKSLTASLKQAEQKAKAARSARDDYEVTLPAAMVMKERAEPRPAHLLIRGAYDNPGEEVGRNTPAFLPPLETKSDLPTRLDLAAWFTDPEHPLTARVTVNRFWQQLFGVGLVRTSEDFGAQGEWPSHPELLDYLATRFIETGWDVKALFREIVQSETYRQSSIGSPDDYARDPDNRMLSRGSRFRVDAEMIRDQVLASSGLLNPELYGKSVKPPQPEGLWKSVALPSSYPREFIPDEGDKIHRRSVYTFWKRGLPPPQMTIFNAPTREACTARRERTNTPLQALVLLNETEYLKAARHLAQAQLSRADAGDSVEILQAIHETITAQLPDEEESEAFLDLLADLETLYRERPAEAAELCAGVTVPANRTPAELAAWTLLTSAIYNLDVTRNRP